MHGAKSLAISLGVILLSSIATAVGQPVMLTFVSMDPIPTDVATGDVVVFSGKLTDINGNGLAGKTIRIEEERATGSNLLATSVTDGNGTYSASWVAGLADPTRDRIMSLSATFAGDNEFSASRSAKVGMTVEIQTMDVGIDLDKQFYFNGESATYTITFASPRGELFDPESMITIYDGTRIDFKRESVGVYKYRTPPLSPPKHTLQLIAEKQGYKVFTDAITFDVFTRQAVVGLKLDFDWSPKPALEGVPVTFNLSFVDTNNVVTPFVNYDLIVKRGDEVALELRAQQTVDGNATHEHTFPEGGKYVVNVIVNGLGQAPDLRPLALSPVYNLDVIKSTAFSVKVKSLQKDTAVRVTIRNPELAPTPVYSFAMRMDDTSGITVRPPTGWTLDVRDDMIMLSTVDNPIEPGDHLRLRAKTDGLLGSFEWTAFDGDGDVLRTSTSTVKALRFG